eukprot:2655254-Pyramimonas_sp.AAC.1
MHFAVLWQLFLWDSRVARVGAGGVNFLALTSLAGSVRSNFTPAAGAVAVRRCWRLGGAWCPRDTAAPENFETCRNRVNASSRSQATVRERAVRRAPLAPTCRMRDGWVSAPDSNGSSPVPSRVRLLQWPPFWLFGAEAGRAYVAALTRLQAPAR